ncbi:Clarin-2 [Channa argus]|uniref:Clarin-2 n=1 Tax=Channa argus TaxID=215402 RepID=A0A6G1PCS4_CHAAH|nr:Clarin-2 [Channa argus]
MPSLWKRITFWVASVLCVGSVVLLVVALSTERWVTGRIVCKTGAEIVNASHLELDQFVGDISYVFPKLVQTLNGGLHVMVILFLFVAIGFALVSLSFCIYNARKVPYQSIKGHKGLYVWNVIAAFFGALGLLCFLAAVRHHSLTEQVANLQESLFVLVVLHDRLDWSFWLGVGSVGTHFVVCGVVAMSQIKPCKLEIKKPQQPTISAVDLLY